MKPTIAVLTGDISHSRKGAVETWMHPLKNTLAQYGEEPKHWELYRGDSFQLAVSAEKALWTALHIKAVIKQTKTYDVRIAIGVGGESYSSEKITESNGSAYVNSGECFEALKKQTLGIKTDDEKLNEALNTMFALSQLTINNWSATVAEAIKTALENPEKNQQEMATLLNKSQSTISEALKRGGFDELMKMNEFYKENISS